MAQCFVEEGWRSWRDAVKGAAETTTGPRKDIEPGYLRLQSPWYGSETWATTINTEKKRLGAAVLS